MDSLEHTNPWAEPTQSGGDSTASTDIPTSTLESETSAATPPSIESPKAKPSAELLHEFDPLADQGVLEDAPAKGNPEPRPSTPVAPTPIPASTAPTTTSAFPSFSSIARTFVPSLPLTLSNRRPLSIDSARDMPVMSPTTMLSFVVRERDRREGDDSPPVKAHEATASNVSGEANERVPEANTSEAQSQPTRSEANDVGSDGKTPTFDFQRFLDQMKSRGAEPIAKYLRSFLGNFAKRTFTVSDQIKLINDFLNFISGHMRTLETSPWRNISDAEFENAIEGMEKLVMNRLYDYTFSPQLPLCSPPRPVTTDDLERDHVLNQRMQLFEWVEEKHLDVPEGMSGSCKGFLDFARQELSKINHYKAPRDKLICILNCCKVIFGLIRHAHLEEGADSFLSILIFVVLKSNPPHLQSNIEYINRFRNPKKLQSEAGYYLSSLIGAVSFVETMDHSSLSNITAEEFERNVETAVQHLPAAPIPGLPQPPVRIPGIGSGAQTPPQRSPHAGEESAQILSFPSIPTPITLAEDTKRFLQKTGDAVSKPLNALGRIFSEAIDGAEEKLINLPGPFGQFEVTKDIQRGKEQAGDAHWAHPNQIRVFSGDPPQKPVGATGVVANASGSQIQTPYKPRVREGRSPNQSPRPGQTRSVDNTPRSGRNAPPSSFLGAPSPHSSRAPTPSLDLGELQSEIDRVHQRATNEAKDTLSQIFPTVEGEVVDMVLEAQGGDLAKSFEVLLEMSRSG